MSEGFLDAVSFVVALVGMEGVAWVVHRFAMHGSLWALHRSHHRGRRGIFELNDLFGVAFAALAIGLFFAARDLRLPALWWFAAGMTGYGLLYAFVHDGVVHRRWPAFPRGHRGYLGRLAQAHRLHHATLERDGAVSFGFLFARNPDRLARDLRRRRKS